MTRDEFMDLVGIEYADEYEKAQLSQKGTTSDTISRQAAIDAVNNAFDRETLLTGFVRSIAVRAIRDMPPAQPEQKWIPCSERMPEKGGKYLCCWQGKTVDTGMFLNGHFRLYGEIKDHLITAWMPLPELFKGETT